MYNVVLSGDQMRTAAPREVDLSAPKPSANQVGTHSFRRILVRWWAVAVIGVIVAVAAATQPYPNGPSIRADGSGYHLWTRAILERDLSFCGYHELEDAGAIAARDTERAVCLNKYPPGLALLRFPVMAPFVDQTPGAPLISVAEHHANATLSALALVLTSVLVLASAYRLGATPVRSNVVVLAAVFGSGLFHYATYDASLTHVYVALCVSFLASLGLRTHRLQPAPWFATVLVGTTSFFLVSIRTLHILIVATFVIICAGWRRLSGGARRFPWFERTSIAAVIGSLVALALEMAYIYWATGRFMLSSYGDETFIFDRPMQAAVFFSVQKGLLVWYPVLGILVGAGLFVRKTRWPALVVVALAVAYGMVYGFWHTWFLGGGFGYRGFVDLVPLAAIVGAVALSRFPRPVAVLTVAAMAVLTAGTVSLMLGYWRGTIPFQGTDLHTFRDHLIGNESIFTP